MAPDAGASFICRSSHGRYKRHMSFKMPQFPGRRIGVAALALLLIGLTGMLPARGSDHERARQALEQGQVLPLRVVLDQVEAEYPGQVIEIEFDREDGRYVYEIKLLQEGGRVVKMDVDAASGEVLKLKRKKPRRHEDD